MINIRSWFTRCREKMVVATTAGVIRDEVRCVLPPEHAGPHVAMDHNKVQVQWITRADLRRYVEEKGRSS